MPRFALTISLVTCALSAAGCTDWDQGAGGNIAVSNDPRQTADVDHTGLVWWETQGTANADANASDDTAADNGFDNDATTGSDDALAVEILDDATANVDASSDATVDGLIAPDGMLIDTSTGDIGGTSDTTGPCSGATKPIGCACTTSQQCASGLCVYGGDGLTCSPSCKTTDCPAGWECVAPALVCKLMASDVVSSDVVTSDAQATDAGTTDAAANGDVMANDVAANDASAVDGSAVDALTPDDTAAMDVPPSDGALFDAPALDAGTTDAVDDAIDDVLDATDQADAPIPDGNLPDLPPSDVNLTDASVSDTDGLTGLDWVGYPDAAFPDDADIYGGAINSCLSLYLYQQETCGKNNPTAACIDEVASQGSLYANYLFEPVRACQDALCVDLCATATDETCMNQCIGKNCPNQFLSCVSNDQHGAADCQTTFSCSMNYPGKLLTIGAKCYANGTLDAQLQVGGLISCETKPNTNSCFQEIATCYDAGGGATATCAQTITCTQNCAGNQECVWQCLGKTNPTARAAIDALGDCMVTVCGPKCNGDQTCQNACLGTDCAVEFGACMGN